ncbi:guanosine monophosphate reductase [Candidatus Pacearchaeota archaeon]|nr:guanosine monophosphate reductase [Candidatus Pacearchaeota archaeon]
MIKEALCYSDVLLVPQYSDIRSRSEVSLQSNLGDIGCEIPIIASPMDTISEAQMAIEMDILGGLAVVHRYNTIERQCDMVMDIGATSAPAIAAIGTSGDYLERATALTHAGARGLCVDVAHGHHILMKEALRKLRITIGDTVHIMAGNVATLEGYNDLVDWGADSVRLGIGGGSICSTRIQTGHGLPGLQTIFDCAVSDRNAPIIADGGLRNSGDIVKALAAGADFVMLGSMLSGADETPGDIINTPTGKVKAYRGMASSDAQIDWRGRASSLEGIATTVPCKGSVSGIIDDLARGLRSGLSYSGARSIKELQGKAKFIRQTSSGQTESSTHILR